MIRRNRHEALGTAFESNNKNCQPYNIRDVCTEKPKLRKYLFHTEWHIIITVSHIDETLKRNHCAGTR